jgi:hypothetical protein
MATNNSINANSTTPLPFLDGGTDVTSVTIVPAATEFAGWDTNKNLSANNHIEGYTTTVSSATPIILTVASARLQYITGTTAQTVTMPVTSTLASIAGGTTQSFTIVNLSTQTVTVNSSGGNLIVSMVASSQAVLTCILNTGTTAASWSSDYALNAAGVASGQGTVNQVLVNGTSGSAQTGALTFTLPQSIATTSPVEFASVQFSGNNGLIDSNGNEIFSLGVVPSAVNNVKVANNSTGNQPGMQAVGSDTNVGFFFKTQLAGVFTFISTSNSPIQVNSGTGPNVATFSFPSGSSSQAFTFPNVSGPIGVGGSLQLVTTLTGSGTYTAPTGTNSLFCIVTGAGGGGGGSLGAASSTAAAGGGGSGGCFGFAIPFTGTTLTFTYACGSAGGGGTAGNNAGTNGNNTTLTYLSTVYTATGGTGGGGATSALNTASLAVLGGAAGTTSGSGIINIIASNGGSGMVALGKGFSGAGGTSYVGAGGNSLIAAGNGIQGVGFGSGGSGAFSSTSSETGGSGNQGAIIVFAYS